MGWFKKVVHYTVHVCDVTIDSSKNIINDGGKILTTGTVIVTDLSKGDLNHAWINTKEIASYVWDATVTQPMHVVNAMLDPFLGTKDTAEAVKLQNIRNQEVISFNKVIFKGLQLSDRSFYQAFKYALYKKNIYSNFKLLARDNLIATPNIGTFNSINDKNVIDYCTNELGLTNVQLYQYRLTQEPFNSVSLHNSIFCPIHKIIDFLFEHATNIDVVESNAYKCSLAVKSNNNTYSKYYDRYSFKFNDTNYEMKIDRTYKIPILAVNTTSGSLAMQVIDTDNNTDTYLDIAVDTSILYGFVVASNQTNNTYKLYIKYKTELPHDTLNMSCFSYVIKPYSKDNTDSNNLILYTGEGKIWD